jgi:zinc transport system substrate-binding protein
MRINTANPINRFTKNALLMVLMILSLIPLLFSCSSSPQTRPLVVVTILPQRDFVEQVAGEHMPDILVLIPPGASPENYEISPAQMQDIGRAKAFFKVGSGLPFEDVWLDRISKLNPQMRIVDCSNGVELMTGAAHHHHEDETENDTNQEGNYELGRGRDPHIWCSPANAMIMVDNIAEGFIEIDPEHDQAYRSNAEKYKEQLKALDAEIRADFADITNRNFIIFHPAWGYFARDYDLNQIAIEIEGKEPKAADLQLLVRTADKMNLKTVFASPQFNTESAKMIAREIKGQVVYIDPLAANYIENMKETAAKLAQAMK